MADKFFPFANLPFKAVDNGDGTYSFSVSGDGGGGGGGVDRELVVTTYRANKNFTGATTGDLITATRMVDVSGADPLPMGATLWRNETTATALASAPLAADIDLAAGGGGITNAEMTALMNAQNLLLGTKTTASTALPAGGAGIIGWLSNLWQSFFGVASGAADSGNPVKVGGVFRTSLPALLNLQRGELMLSSGGAAMIQPTIAGGAIGDATASGDIVGYPTRIGTGNPQIFSSAVMYFNGTTWDRARGNTSGAFVQGNVASGAADAGNPVKVGAVYNVSPPALSSGARSDLFTDVRGNLKVSINDGVSTASVGTTTADSQGVSLASLAVRNFNFVFNGGTWDRARGDATGQAVNVLKAPLVARKLTVNAVTAEVALTAGVKRVSIYARGTDVRFVIANATGGTVNNATDHFIAAGERLEFGDLNTSIGGTPFIKVIRDADVSADGTLNITELS